MRKSRPVVPNIFHQRFASHRATSTTAYQLQRSSCGRSRPPLLSRASIRHLSSRRQVEIGTENACVRNWEPLRGRSFEATSHPEPRRPRPLRNSRPATVSTRPDSSATDEMPCCDMRLWSERRQTHYETRAMGLIANGMEPPSQTDRRSSPTRPPESREPSSRPVSPQPNLARRGDSDRGRRLSVLDRILDGLRHRCAACVQPFASLPKESATDAKHWGPTESATRPNVAASPSRNADAVKDVGSLPFKISLFRSAFVGSWTDHLRDGDPYPGVTP